MSTQSKLKRKKFNPALFRHLIEQPVDEEKPRLEPVTIPFELQQAWKEHKKLKPRPSHIIPLQVSNRLIAYLMEAKEVAREIEYRWSVWRIRSLKKREASNPMKNTEIFPEKEEIQEA